MPLLTENQLTDIVDMIVDDYGSRLTGGEVSEVIGLILAWGFLLEGNGWKPRSWWRPVDYKSIGLTAISH